MKQFKFADFGLRHKGLNYAGQWKQRKRTRREDTAIRGMYWALTLFVVVAFALLLTGCGRDHEDPAYTWDVAINALDMTAETRTWEICGGKVTFTYTMPSTSKEDTDGGFYGTATAAQAGCYMQYGVYTSITRTGR